MTVEPTTLCICHHLNASHDNGERCTFPGCKCERFNYISRKSSNYYQRGQRTETRRVARLQEGDVVLVGYPGHDEYVRGHDGGIVWEQHPGELTSHPQVRHVHDFVLRPMQNKTRALLARVTGRRMVPSQKPEGWRRAAPAMHVIDTTLGELSPMYGANTVLVLVKEGDRS